MSHKPYTWGCTDPRYQNGGRDWTRAWWFSLPSPTESNPNGTRSKGYIVTRPGVPGYWITWGGATGPYTLGPYETLVAAQAVYLFEGGGTL